MEIQNNEGKRTALITGASSGLGEQFARAYAKRGLDLVLTARRAARLVALAGELEGKHGIRCLTVSADLADPGAPAAIFRAVEESHFPVDVLVNNAGFGIGGHFLAHPWSDHERFLRVMVGAQVELLHRFLPGMRARGYGRVINVASVAGLIPGTAGHTLYGPAKALLIKLSESLSLEHQDHGIHVTALCPGYTHTEFHDVLGNREQMNELPGFLWLRADRVVRAAIAASERGQVLCVPGWIYKALTLLVRLLPHRLQLMIAARGSRKIRSQEST